MREGLYLGDLSGPESRLTLLWLGVRGVVTPTLTLTPNPSPRPNPNPNPSPSPSPSPDPGPNPNPNPNQVTVASHDIERLWMADGIAYHLEP